VISASVKTVQRRVNRARQLLAAQLADLRPAAPSESLAPNDTLTL